MIAHYSVVWSMELNSFSGERLWLYFVLVSEVEYLYHCNKTTEACWYFTLHIIFYSFLLFVFDSLVPQDDRDKQFNCKHAWLHFFWLDMQKSQNLLIICFYFLFYFINWLQIESENKVLPVYSLDAEFARPLWVFGMNSYDFVQSHKQRNLIACSYR